MERLGIVGLPNSGKSSLFNALTSMGVEVGAHPFTTTGTHVGTAQIPDTRLSQLAMLSQSARVVPAGLHVIDIAGLVSGASAGEGLGNRFLAQIRECEAILYVLRAFVDSAVVYETDPIDPAADLAVLECELCMVDLESLEARLPKLTKAAQVDKSLAEDVRAMEAAHGALEDGVPLYRSAVTRENRARLRDLFLLTNKSAIYVVNIGEDDIGDEAGIEDALRGAIDGHDATIAAACVALEAEVAEVEDLEQREELLASYGVGAPVLPRVARAAHSALGRRTFITTNEKETRAWTIRAGASVREAAGVVHSDMERGFIRADVAPVEDVIAAGGWDAARKAGILRLEGKDYVVQDGDVIGVRFNV